MNVNNKNSVSAIIYKLSKSNTRDDQATQFRLQKMTSVTFQPEKSVDKFFNCDPKVTSYEQFKPM